VLVARGVGKRFHRFHADRPVTLKEVLLRGIRRMAPAESFWALKDVSFDLAEGQTLGLVGANGAGKSTLLRLLAGVGRPDAGSIDAAARVGALLDLGAGFHPDLTGRENVFVCGVVNGLLRQEVAARFDDIVAFAELEEFIDSPLRTYSTGMQMRLGFALAVHTDPQILLIDEILAVGDVAFQRRCLDRIAQFKAAGTTIVLVSHEASLVRELCDQALWLRSGAVAAHGPSDVVVAQYLAEMSSETRRRTPIGKANVEAGAGALLRLNENRFGSQELEITRVALLDGFGLPVGQLRSGDGLRIEIEYVAHQMIAGPIFGVTIEREDGALCYETSTASAGLQFGDVRGQGRLTLSIDRLDLNGGSFQVSVGAYQRSWAYAYDYHWRSYALLVGPAAVDKGILRPASTFSVAYAHDGVR
jgi:lipopolysaccharide transport system ATP-binding protein